MLSQVMFKSSNPLDSDYNLALLYHSEFAVANIKRNGKQNFNNSDSQKSCYICSIKKPRVFYASPEKQYIQTPILPTCP